MTPTASLSELAHGTAVPGCVFCTPSRLPDHEVLTGPGGYGLFRVFTPLNPVTPGHLLVVPLVHTRHAAENPRVAGGAMYVAAQVARRYAAANIITSIGQDATQSVWHLHLHVVPRHHGDGLPLPWTPQQEASR